LRSALITEDNSQLDWQLVSIECGQGTPVTFDTVDGISSAQLTLEPGGFVECVFTNEPTPPTTVNITKSVSEVPAEGTPEFQVQVNGAGDSNDFVAIAADETISVDVNPVDGQVEFAENLLPAPGWLFGSLVCDGQSIPVELRGNFAIAAIAIQPGGVVDCVVENEFVGPAVVNLTKEVSVVPPGGAPTFTVAVNAETGSVGAGETITFETDSAPLGGQVEISEQPIMDWTFDSIVCPGKTPIEVTPATFRIEMQRGEVVDCVITNTWTPVTATVNVTKTVTEIPAGGTPTFKIDVFGSEDGPTVDVEAGETVSVEVIPIDGKVQFGENYLLVPDWVLNSLTCDGEALPVVASASGVTSTIDIQPGGVVDCVVENEFAGPAVVNVTKQVTELPASGAPAFGVFVNGEAGSVAVGETATFEFDAALFGGQALIFEPPVSGWTFDSIDCAGKPVEVDLLQPEITFQVEPGEVVNCVITNAPIPSFAVLNLTKAVTNVQPANAPTFLISVNGDTRSFEPGETITYELDLADTGGLVEISETFGDLPWTLGSVGCFDNVTTLDKVTTRVDDGQSVKIKLEMEPGEVVDCLLINAPLPATVNITKQVVEVPAEGTPPFPIEVNFETRSVEVGETITFEVEYLEVTRDATGGILRIVEDLTQTSGWAFSSIDCPGKTLEIGNLADIFVIAEGTVQPGEIVDCVVTNEFVGPAVLNLTKAVTEAPGGETPLFPVTVNGEVRLFEAGETVTFEFDPFGPRPGIAEIGETFTDVPGWTFDSIDCVSTAPDSNLDITETPDGVAIQVIADRAEVVASDGEHHEVGYRGSCWWYADVLGKCGWSDVAG